jgi:hypothetical protein
MSAGGVIDTTTFRNNAWRTKKEKQLKDMLASAFTAAYDPALLTTLMSYVGINQLITVSFRESTASWTFWGILNEFKPGEHVEGEMPTAEFSIEPTNLTDAGVEQGPALIP